MGFNHRFKWNILGSIGSDNNVHLADLAKALRMNLASGRSAGAPGACLVFPLNVFQFCFGFQAGPKCSKYKGKSQPHLYEFIVPGRG